MTDEKTKPVKQEVDFLIKAFSKPLTIAFVISLVFLVLLCLHRPNDNVVSYNDSLIMISSSKKTEVKKQWHIRTDYYYNLMAKLSKPVYKPIRPLLDPLPQDYEMYDPNLISIIQSYFLIPPSTEDYALKNPLGFDTSMGQAAAVRKILGEKKNGFFIECGALDGETRSNTLILEEELDWSGILIDADPVNLMNCLDKHRKAWIVPACLSPVKKSTTLKFRALGHVGSIFDGKIHPADFQLKREHFTEDKIMDVNCFPLASLLFAMNKTKIDYLSLDIEGNELEVLKTIPFEEFDIHVISVEFDHNKKKNRKHNEDLKSYMISQGYRLETIVTAKWNLANDFIFVKDKFADRNSRNAHFVMNFDG